MKLGILGAGDVGGTLGAAWAATGGHDICFGVTDPSKEKTKALLKRIGPKAHAATAREAAAHADMVVLATPWQATQQAILDADGLEKKIVLDCTNPLSFGPDGLSLAVGLTSSGGEIVQSWAPQARVFKTLNTTGFRNMSKPAFQGGLAVMFVAGDFADIKPRVMALVRELGFDVIDAGPLKAARLLEPHAMLWIDLALNRGLGTDWAFGILKH